MRSSKEIAKRLRFELKPRPYAFRRLYLALGVAGCVAALVAWQLASRWMGNRQYLPGPVTSAHATFGDRCELCHAQAFSSVPDEACLDCHAPGIHSEHERPTPACIECHVEHRGAEAMLAASPQACIGCHAALETSAPAARIAAVILDFDSHPPFVPVRQGVSDRTALRFNHRLHLESDRIPADRRLDCPSCHLADAAGARMQPIVFEVHCRSCHTQNVAGPLGDIEVLHESPEAVRQDLKRRLLGAAVDDPQAVFGEPDFFLPGRRRGPIDQSKDLGAYQQKWLNQAEAKLYASFDPTSPLEQHNKYCFLCHLQGEAAVAEGLADVAKTGIPGRWLERAEFSHRAHRLVACEDCHAAVRGSEHTADVNLPGIQPCATCHVDGVDQSAGTSCLLCHVYHAGTRHPEAIRAKDRSHRLDSLLGTGPPPAPSP